MTQAFLQSELASLISDSKRRYNDVRTAAEQSLSDLRAISVTSETQLAGDLFRRPQFIDPFILACRSKNVKLVSIGTVCLHRLTVNRAIARIRLPDVLDAFQEGVASGYESQLKILQTLPSLLQFYANDLHGHLLASTLEICAALQSSRTAAVSNTAAATFQQLISAVFEQAGQAERVRTSGEHSAEDSQPDAEFYQVSLDDAIRLFQDFCSALNQQRPQFLKVESLPPGFLLETLHTIISTNDSFLASEKDQERKCWEDLIQGISRILAKKDHFAMTVRALSILLLIFQDHANDLREQLIHVTPLLLATLEKDGNPMWKRALCLEFFQHICSDFGVMRNVFNLFDRGEGSATVIGEFMSALVRIASEDPSLIGLGRQSTVPVQRATDLKSDEAASIEAQGLGGAITSVTGSDATTTGISTEWSVVAVRLMDQPEKHSPPPVPSSYLYTLVLGCISSFCDGLSKFVMPLSVPSRGPRESLDRPRRDSAATDPADDDVSRKSNKSSSSQKYQRLINPLTLSSHPLLPEIQTSADMIDACWPAALATCSTFLNSALDSEFYHMLIRSIQKLAQVAGVLELPTPRDALLTTLAKASVPANASSIISAFQQVKIGRIGGSEHDNPTEAIKSPTEAPPTPTFQINSPPLNVRHLLCLRALLNLGIALGPSLETDAWFILIETMQRVEALIAIPTTMAASSQSTGLRAGLSTSDPQTTLAGEIAAVQAATKRMLDSTRGYSAESFAVAVQALLRLLGQEDLGDSSQPSDEQLASPTSPTETGAPRPTRHNSRSVSGIWTRSKILDLEISFFLNKISELSRINIHRFASASEQSCSWDLIGVRLLRLSQDSTYASSHRIQSASILDLISMETIKLLDDPRFEAEEADIIKSRCLKCLLQQLESFDQPRGGRYDDIDVEIHRRLLEALESILSDSGESLSKVWPRALEILAKSFAKRGEGQPRTSAASIEQAESDERTAQILRTAFRSIQLITSDFLGVLEPRSLATLAQLLRKFGTQQYDLNVALTSTTLLWSLASQALSKVETIDLKNIPVADLQNNENDLGSDAPTPDVLWSIILLQLIQLCKDERPDVRNAATRVLLKMLDASSENLSSNAWSTTLALGPLSITRFCITEAATDGVANSEWMASAAQLTDGTVQLVAQNLNVIASHDGFKDTWLRILEVLKEILGTMSLSASSLAFSNLSRLLSVLPGLGKVNEELLIPVMELWASYHPADIEGQSKPSGRSDDDSHNQASFASHAHVLVEAYKTSPESVVNYSRGRTQLVMDSVERSVLFCTHPPYTSDVRSLALEQKEACACLTILKTLLGDNVSSYSRYLLRLVKLTLGIHNGKISFQLKRSAMSKTVEKPSFIAFVSTCLENFRNLILEYAGDDLLIHTMAIQEALEILPAIISTKYTKLPTNSQAPLWRTATVTTVVLLEALQKHAARVSETEDLSRLGQLAPGAISAIVSVLDPGGLTLQFARQHEEAVMEDEAFDVEYFELLHRALVRIFQHPMVGEDARRQYAITLFNASLLAEPWFYDIPDDLTMEPLKGLTEVRPGSVHQPIFSVRRSLCYTALDALFELVAEHKPGDKQGEMATTESHNFASTACPYLILRVVHPLKTFLADQRLRGFTPPPMPQQVELQVVLSKFVELRSDGEALWKTASSLRNRDQAHEARNGQSKHNELSIPLDGKEHLRILHSLILRVQKFWRGLPRLKGGGAWQDDEPGRGIEEALEEWNITLAERWRHE